MPSNNSEYARAYYQKHRDRIRTQRKLRQKENTEYNRKWRLRNRQRYNNNNRLYRIKRRRKIIEHYSGIPPKCSCCGEKEYLCLTIDHIDGDGKENRLEIGQSNIEYWIFKNDFPNGIQILCYNCNFAKAKNNNICPHKS